MSTIIWDLDSTLCDTRHRRHLMPERDQWHLNDSWVDYSRACGDDEPIPGAVALFKLLMGGHDLIVMSARSGLASVRRDTHAWLIRHGMDRYQTLILRPVDSPLSPTEWKKARLQWMVDAGQQIDLAIDGHPGTAAVFAELGIPTLVVTPPGIDYTQMAHL